MLSIERTWSVTSWKVVFLQSALMCTILLFLLTKEISGNGSGSGTRWALPRGHIWDMFELEMLS